MADIKKWDVDDTQFWESEGKRIANRNLWISIPAVLGAFTVWMYWSIITVQMLNVGFPFTQPELFTLAAIAGLTGATLRIPNSFFIRIAGGRNTIFFTTALLIIPALGTGIALQDQHTPLWVFQGLAFLSGLGGGNFSSSMANISPFFPKRKQGTALGLNAGLGDFGVPLLQIVIPLAMTFGIFGLFGGDPMTLKHDSGSLIGKIPTGSKTWIQNAAYVWLLLLVPMVFATWFGMNNIRTQDVSPHMGSPTGAFSKITGMLLIGFLTSAAGIYILLPTGLGAPHWAMWPVVAGVIVATVLLLKMIPGDIKPELQHQYTIFGNKHTWIMSILYTMTFGSFIGFAAGFALSIKVVFGFQHIAAAGEMTRNVLNPNAPSALMYAWIGPFIGAVIRPVGGWMADKWGGAKVTQLITIAMIASALGVAYYLHMAYASKTPEQYFYQFLGLFVILFAASGIGSGSTTGTIANVFNKEQAGSAVGWTGAMGAYGAFIIPSVFGGQIKAGTPENALYGFAVFYGVCLLLNWWYYLGPKAEFKNP
jgi:NNP family nitrate/nitrite transporter-like MFS transporter